MKVISQSPGTDSLQWCMHINILQPFQMPFGELDFIHGCLGGKGCLDGLGERQFTTAAVLLGAAGLNDEALEALREGAVLKYYQRAKSILEQ